VSLLRRYCQNPPLARYGAIYDIVLGALFLFFATWASRLEDKVPPTRAMVENLEEVLAPQHILNLAPSSADRR
jgi:hypothetical protein